MRVLSIVLPLAVTPSFAATNTIAMSPKAWMESVAPKIATVTETEPRDRLERQIETKNFHTFLSKVDDDHGFAWNADFLMGVQEMQGWRVTGVVEDLATDSEAVEAVHYRNGQDADEIVVRYRLIKENSAWRIDDAMFGKDWRSIRYDMTKAVEPH